MAPLLHLLHPVQLPMCQAAPLQLPRIICTASSSTMPLARALPARSPPAMEQALCLAALAWGRQAARPLLPCSGRGASGAVGGV